MEKSEKTTKIIYWNRFCTIVNQIVTTAGFAVFLLGMKKGEWLVAVAGAAVLMLSMMVRLIAGDLARLQDKILQSEKPKNNR